MSQSVEELRNKGGHGSRNAVIGHPHGALCEHRADFGNTSVRHTRNEERPVGHAKGAGLYSAARSPEVSGREGMQSDLHLRKTLPAVWTAEETEAKVLLPTIQFSIRQTAYYDQMVI